MGGRDGKTVKRFTLHQTAVVSTSVNENWYCQPLTYVACHLLVYLCLYLGCLLCCLRFAPGSRNIVTITQRISNSSIKWSPSMFTRHAIFVLLRRTELNFSKSLIQSSKTEKLSSRVGCDLLQQIVLIHRHLSPLCRICLSVLLLLVFCLKVISRSISGYRYLWLSFSTKIRF